MDTVKPPVVFQNDFWSIIRIDDDNLMILPLQTEVKRPEMHNKYCIATFEDNNEVSFYEGEGRFTNPGIRQCAVAWFERMKGCKVITRVV